MSRLPIWIFLVPFLAITPLEAATVVGATANCAKWTAARKNEIAATARRHTDPLTYVPGTDAYVQWLLGFLSALAITREEVPDDILEAVDGNLIRDWMDTYCRRSPTKHTTDGAFDLLDELKKHQSARPSAAPKSQPSVKSGPKQTPTK